MRSILTIISATTLAAATLVAMIALQEPAPKPRILVFTKTATFRHDSIPQGITCVQELLAPDVEVVATEDSAQFTAENLKSFRAVVFLSTTGDVLNDAQQTAFQEFIESGGGFAGIHAASDTEHDWVWYDEMIGA
ncbi:MAG: ThuA domain-containing protein, partial [Phycisphaerales bacterium]|nr:ThuA domain-containing protein [Phycisphaerales bacterium]